MKTKPALSWHQKGQNLLEEFLKKAKSPKGRVLVLSPLGDMLLMAGKGPAIDTTSAGAIMAAMNTATGGLNAIFKTKASTIRFGASDKELWMYVASGNWMIVGAHIPLKLALLKPIEKHLKTAAKFSRAINAPEALEGMSETTVDVAIAQSLDRG